MDTPPGNTHGLFAHLPFDARILNNAPVRRFYLAMLIVFCISIWFR
ncbi:MAG: hypothetical protein ACP5OR_04095 [Candidatus Dormibacteria bacterium]